MILYPTITFSYLFSIRKHVPLASANNHFMHMQQNVGLFHINIEWLKILRFSWLDYLFLKNVEQVLKHNMI